MFITFKAVNMDSLKYCFIFLQDGHIASKCGSSLKLKVKVEGYNIPYRTYRLY